MEAIALPGDVIVGVHDAADGVEDEEEQEDEPVGQVVPAFPLHVRHDEGDQGGNGGGLDIKISVFRHSEKPTRQRMRIRTNINLCNLTLK